MAASKRKVIPVLVLILGGACLLSMIALLVMLRLYPPVPTPLPAPASFPATDIVYRGDTELGFINADGSGATTVPFRLPYIDVYASWRNPILAGDNKTLIVTNAGYSGVVGNIFVAHAGKAVVDCKWWGIARLAADGSHILLETQDGQEQYLPDDCGTGKPPKKVYSNVFGALSPDEQYSVEARWSEPGVERKPSMILHDLKTGEERVVGVGDLPAWSRDGQWLAYTGVDGIFIVQNSPNAEPRRLVFLESPEPSLEIPVYRDYPPNEYYSPIASWSPDGQWLVYHVYSRDLVVPDAGAWAGHYSIFKINVNTGETTKLLNGGYSPFWRWPVEEP